MTIPLWLSDNEQAPLRAMHMVGYALWQIQVLESALLAHLVLGHDAEPGCTKEELQAALGRRKKQTFGKVLWDLERALEVKTTLDAGLQQRLGVFKDERNWLAHHSRVDCHVALNDASGREEVFRRLDAIADEALALMKEVQKATETYLHSRGLSSDAIDTNAAKIRGAWARGERHPDEVHKT